MGSQDAYDDDVRVNQGKQRAADGGEQICPWGDEVPLKEGDEVQEEEHPKIQGEQQGVAKLWGQSFHGTRGVLIW